ncbi:ABC transporter substrate-binding protein [Dissulfurimicrobium hydrothermale]|uniref:ABC transporter substrate-binding protein n=1 Tax=Dissulfurimicrobium hydrothermale TaxID=1750598 RepID=UPI001EDC2C51|nr:ABC transporter substrate binding protein [Dissulfurimicrobium hydrothermale]UKL12915.1 hypothetical protein LGS26_05310 [Dissulfurimicrobium hydrothermale]
MKRFIFLLAFAATVLFLSQPIIAADEDIKQVVIIRYPIEPMAFQGVVDGFKKAMASQGLREGRDVIYIDILTRWKDERSVPEVLDAVKRYKKKAALFVTCGWVSLYVKQALKGSDTPQIFVPVLDSVALELVPGLSHPSGLNITGVYLMYPPGKVLRLAMALIPGLKRMAYVYDSRIPADLSYKKAFEAVTETGAVKVIYPDIAKGMNEVTRVIRRSDVQAVCYLVGGMRYVKELNELGVPIVTAYAFDVDETALKKRLAKEKATLAGYFNPFSYCGFRAGLMAARILTGTKAGEIAPEAARQMLFINLTASKMFLIPIDLQALETADLVIR